jgi:Ca-activated chloride channel family protein
MTGVASAGSGLGAGVGGVVAAVRAWAHEGIGGVSFDRPWLLLALLPVVGAIAWGALRARRIPTLALARGDEAAALPVGRAIVARRASRVLASTTAVLLAVGLAGPVVRGEPDPATTEGIDIVVALDVSGSMRAADFRPNDRLFVAKQVIAEHVLQRPRDRIGLVVFAGEAFTQAPLTHDRALVQGVLAGVRTGVIKDGTAIGDGLALALARLETSTAKTRTVILLTDGDNNAGELAPETAVELATKLGVRVYPILVGKGGRVPFPDGVDIFGAPRFVTVEMPVNPALLKSVAAKTGGAFFQATDRQSLETSFQKILESLDKSVLDGSPPVRRRLPLLPLLVLPALLCFVAAVALRHTRASTVP